MFSKVMRNDFDMQRNYRNLWQDDFVAKLPVSISALFQFHPVFYIKGGKKMAGKQTLSVCSLALQNNAEQIAFKNTVQCVNKQTVVLLLHPRTEYKKLAHF